jgi:hypothetical protein
MLKYFVAFIVLAVVNLIRGDAKMAAGNLLGGALIFPLLWWWRKQDRREG